MGWLAGAMAGGGAAGIEAVDLLQKSDLQSQRDARLNEWKVESENRLADRQEASDARRADREDTRDTKRAEREDTRWKTQVEIQDKRDAAAAARHDETTAVQREAIAARERSDERRHQQLMGRIAASNSGSGDKAEDREVNRQIQIAKEYREAGNTDMANKILERLVTRTSGLPPPPTKLPPLGKPGSKADADVAPGGRPSATSESPAMVTDPASPAGKFQARQAASSQGGGNNSAATQKALFILESGDVGELYKFQATPEFNSLDRDLKQTISNRINGR